MAKHTPPEQIDSWRKFTKRIYTEWDADPGYYALAGTEMPYPQKLRLAVAWCTFYNLGIAADASEYKGKDFWNYLEKIYPTAKRASERRHFRGAAGLKALAAWSVSWPNPEDLTRFMLNHVNGKSPAEGETYFSIRKRGQMVPQYGDYFYWKWCDLHEVLGAGAVDMTGSEMHSPKVPQQGAMLIYELAEAEREDWRAWKKAGVKTPAGSDRDPRFIVPATYAEIIAYGRKHSIPPRTTDQRPFCIQEAETVCCVYKQMASGSYVYGSRTAKAVARLRSGKSDTARRMAETLLRLSPYEEDQLAEILANL